MGLDHFNRMVSRKSAGAQQDDGAQSAVNDPHPVSQRSPHLGLLADRACQRAPRSDPTIEHCSQDSDIFDGDDHPAVARVADGKHCVTARAGCPALSALNDLRPRLWPAHDQPA